MKILNLLVDLTKLENISDDEKKKDPREVSINVIKTVILTLGNQNRGLSEEERRLYYKICDVFDKAKADKLDSVELEDNYASFVQKAFKESKLMPNELLRQVEDHINDIKDKEIK